MTKIINLLAGPGAGKSTTGSALFALMNSAGEKVELVTEYAKDLVWDGSRMDNQLAMLGKQDKRLYRLLGKVDYVITDSPLILADIYVDPNSRHADAEFGNTVRWAFRSYENLTYHLERLPTFSPIGRNQGTIEEALAIDKKLLDYLKRWQIPFKSMEVGPDIAPMIYTDILQRKMMELYASFNGETHGPA